MKKYVYFITVLLLTFLLMLSNCVTTPDSASSGESTENSYRYKAISLLENMFYNYENQNYNELKKVFSSELGKKFSLIKDSIRDEFRKYDLVKITFTIDKVEKINNLIIVRFKWTKNRRGISSGTFSSSVPGQEKSGNSIFTFESESGKLTQIAGDYIFGLGR